MKLYFSKNHSTYIVLLALLSVFVLFGITGHAAESLITPYESYTYDFWKWPVPAPQAYLPLRMVTGLTMGAEALSNPQDITVVGSSTYILDTGKNRIVEVDENWQFVRSINEFQNGDEVDRFSGPEGFFITDEGTIYVADTNKERIVVLDNDGNLLNIITSPHVDYEHMFPDRFVFRPRKIGVDTIGRIYTIAQDLYDGVVVMDNDGKFNGFVGAPRVATTALELFWAYIQSDEQRDRSQLYLPIEYASIDINSEGFIYAVVAGPAEDEAIKLMNPAGVDILTRNGFTPIRGDSEVAFDKDEDNDTRSRFIDIVGREYGMYSALDRQRGRIFTYDNQGNLLYVFGGIGDAIGLFTRPQAITARGEEIIVLDADGRITIFGPTEYAKLIHAALAYYDGGDYLRSTEIWDQLTIINPNLDVAHSGIGRALFYDGFYEEAMESFRHGQNRSGYSQAFTKFRQNWVGDNFGLVAAIIIIVTLLIVANLRYGLLERFKKSLGKKFVNRWAEPAATTVYMGVPIEDTHSIKAFFLRTLDGVNYARYLIFHPFDGFWDLKHEKRGSVAAANVILLFTVLSWVFTRQYMAFIFNTRRVQYLNILTEALTIIIPLLLWCACNWALTTLMEGKGTFRDIYIATCYALTPLVVIFVPMTLISYGLAQPEGAFLELAIWIALIWVGALVLAGNMITHEYSGAKTIITAVATVAGILIVLFILLLFTSLVNQLIGFVYKLYLELAFR